jgi:predicted ArsR family transcriptional regulator
MNLFEFADQQPRYPIEPGYKARSTSLSAARSLNDKAPRLRQLCVDQLLLYGPLTADEAAANLGIDKLSIRPRFSELAAAGKIFDSGERRANGSGKRAIVWALVR